MKNVHSLFISVIRSRKFVCMRCTSCALVPNYYCCCCYNNNDFSFCYFVFYARGGLFFSFQPVRWIIQFGAHPTQIRKLWIAGEFWAERFSLPRTFIIIYFRVRPPSVVLTNHPTPLHPPTPPTHGKYIRRRCIRLIKFLVERFSS